MSLYPIHVDIAGWRCLVVGGGQVAHRKVTSLLASAAKVEIVAPELNLFLQKLVNKDKVKHIASNFRDFYLDTNLKQYQLVFGATDDSELNRTIAKVARKKGVMVNIADTPQDCTFMVPAVFRQGDLTVSISTNGNSPALSRSLRKKMESEWGTEVAELTRFLGEVRQFLLTSGADPEYRRDILQCLGNIEVADFYRRGEGKTLETLVWNYLQEKSSDF